MVVDNAHKPHSEPFTAGRLAKPTSALLQNYIDTPFLEKELQNLPSVLKVDYAHLVMLANQGLIPKDQASLIVQALEDLSKDEPEQFTAKSGYGTLNLQIEEYLSQRLGQDTAGRLPIGRSRIDHGATVRCLADRDNVLRVQNGLLALSVEACENAKALSLSPQTQISPIQVYHCFNCGISLLQCLALRPMILPPRRTVRAIVAYSSALAIYTKSRSTASIFLELFERLSDKFLGNDEDMETPRHTDLSLRPVLGEVISSAPADMPKILRSLSGKQGEGPSQSETFVAQDLGNEYMHLEFPVLGSTTSPAFDTGDFTEPFEMFYDMAHLYDYDGRRRGSG